MQSTLQSVLIPQLIEEKNQHTTRCQELALLIKKLDSLDETLSILKMQGIYLNPEAILFNSETPKITREMLLEANVAMYNSLINHGFIETTRTHIPTKAEVTATLTLTTGMKELIIDVELPVHCRTISSVQTDSGNSSCPE